jgi:hypothetical protein
VALVGLELRRSYLKNADSLESRSRRAAVRRGLQNALPLTTVLTFIMVPSTSTKVFKTFLCDRIEYQMGESERKYLHDDLALSCETDEYQRTKDMAVIMVQVWPVGALRSPTDGSQTPPFH